nr:hypothetical protein [Peribacillus sp. TH27]
MKDGRNARSAVHDIVFSEYHTYKVGDCPTEFKSRVSDIGSG